MNRRELAKSLIDLIPEGKLPYIVAYLQGACVPEETSHDKTAEVIKEVERIIDDGTDEDSENSAVDALRTLQEFLQKFIA